MRCYKRNFRLGGPYSFKALTQIYHLGIQDVFVKMSVEERLGWIQSSME